MSRNSGIQKAVILAAGKGTRMGELTKELPKPMVEVNGKPVLQHIVEGLKASGLTRFFIITGWRAEVVEEHFGDGSRFGVSITYGRQVVQDGTGKAPEIAKEWVGDDTFLMTYGDILVTQANYAAMLERFASAAGSAIGLLSVKRGEDIRKGGLVLFDRDMVMTELVEKPSEDELRALERAGKIGPGVPVWYNAGVYIFQPAVYGYTAKIGKSPRGEYELTDALKAMARDGRKLLGHEMQGHWVDVRDPKVLQETQGIRLN